MADNRGLAHEVLQNYDKIMGIVSMPPAKPQTEPAWNGEQ